MRSRAHPWWGERVDLDPNHYDYGDDGSVTVRVPAWRCQRCHEDITGHYYTYANGDTQWSGPWCKRNTGIGGGAA